MTGPRKWAGVGSALFGYGITAKFGPAGAAIFVGVLIVAWAIISEIADNLDNRVEKVRRDNENLIDELDPTPKPRDVVLEFTADLSRFQPMRAAVDPDEDGAS